MKTTNKYRPYSTHPSRSYAYPNAADRSYFVGKILDGITALVTGMATITLLFYFITI